MSNVEIALIAPYKRLAELAIETYKEWGVEIHVAIADASESVAIAKELIDRGIKILISRGDTASTIRSAVNVPVVDIPITTWDIIKAIQESKEFGKKIGVVGLENFYYEIKNLEKLFKVNFFHIPVEEMIAGKLLDSIIQQKLEVVMGDFRIKKIYERQNFPAVIVDSGKQALREALEKARGISTVQRQELLKNEMLRAILNSTSGGIIAVNQQGKISYFNKQAERLLSINMKEILNKKYSKYLAFIPFEDSLRFKHARIGNVNKIQEKTLISDVIPIDVGQDVLGAVCTIKDADYICSIKEKLKANLGDGLTAKYNFDDIVTNDEVMKKTIEKAKKYACVDSTVLIIGETGTGKELFAQSIHNYSARREGPFVSVNCAALPHNLLESELFGYEEGAFTGAKKGGKKGLFELAEHGTVFLDEIGEISPDTQAMLLRVLQQREVMRVGGNKNIPINVRVIAATNKNLAELVERNFFRRDLYHRLNVLNLRLPALRERKKDLPLLAAVLSEKIADKLKIKTPLFTEDAIEVLKNYSWLGNIRELENILERLIVIKGGSTVEKSDVVDIIGDEGNKKNESSTILLNINTSLAEMEKNIINEVIKISNNKEEAAKRLGISTTTIWRKLKSTSK